MTRWEHLDPPDRCLSRSGHDMLAIWNGASTVPEAVFCETCYRYGSVIVLSDTPAPRSA